MKVLLKLFVVISVQNQNGGEFNTANFSNLRHIYMQISVSGVIIMVFILNSPWVLGDGVSTWGQNMLVQ